MEVIPAINVPGFAIAKKQAAIIKSFLPRGSWVHLDVSDGVFSAVKNWGEAAEFKGLKLGFYKTEVHLMVENPEDAAELWLKEIASPAPARGRDRNDDGVAAVTSSPRNDINGQSYEVELRKNENVIASPPAERGGEAIPRNGTNRDCRAPALRGLAMAIRARIIAHLEAIRNSSHILDLCQEYGAELMIAINPETLVENLIPYFHNIKYFQILAVAPGQSGQKFQKAVLEKVRFLRERVSDAIIEIDGGVNPETAVQAREAGADMVVSASYIMNAKSPQEAYRNLSDL